MHPDKKCKFCRRAFQPRRKNQFYCSDQCRHAFGNEKFRNKTAHFEFDKLKAIEQDLVLQSLFRPNQRILIAERNFRELSIDITNAKTQVFLTDRKLARAIFTNFILERVDQQIFELKKL